MESFFKIILIYLNVPIELLRFYLMRNEKK